MGVVGLAYDLIEVDDSIDVTAAAKTQNYRDARRSRSIWDQLRA